MATKFIFFTTMPILFILLIIPGSSYALRAKTFGGHIACFSKSDLHDIIIFSVDKDYDSARAYINQKKCWVLKKDIPITVIDAGWSKCQCVFKGIKFWTVREALNFDK